MCFLVFESLILKNVLVKRNSSMIRYWKTTVFYVKRSTLLINITDTIQSVYHCADTSSSSGNNSLTHHIDVVRVVWAGTSSWRGLNLLYQWKLNRLFGSKSSWNCSAVNFLLSHRTICVCRKCLLCRRQKYQNMTTPYTKFGDRAFRVAG